MVAIFLIALCRTRKWITAEWGERIIGRIRRTMTEPLWILLSFNLNGLYVSKN